jgi:hypothetical protein
LIVQTTKLGFKISATDALLDLAVVLDGQVQWQGRPGTDVQEVSVEFEDADDQTHVLEFVLSGKTPDHTQITEHGEITSDVTIQIRDIAFDDIAIDQIFSQLAEYHHDFNGTQSAVVDRFYGEMGCNGTVRLEFTTPIYLWLLENM